MTNVNFIGEYVSLSALWAEHPEGGIEGDYALVGDTYYGWNRYTRQWEQTTLSDGQTPSPLLTTNVREADIDADEEDDEDIPPAPNAVDTDYLGSFASIQDVWAFFPEGGNEGEYIAVAGQVYTWSNVVHNWIVSEDRTITISYLASTPATHTRINYLGAFDTLSDVWVFYPEGGYEGDYVHIAEEIKVWNKWGREWGTNADPTSPAITNQTIEGDLTVLHNLIVAGVIRAPQIIAGAATDTELWFGHRWDDYMDQPVRTTDVVQFAKVIAAIMQSPDFASGINDGIGWKLGQYGDAELESLTLRRFLEVPELRYNRTSVEVGNKWTAPGSGLIESVVVDYDDEGNELMTGTITLHLEDGESGAVAVNDICQGIFHDGLSLLNNSTADTDDSRGNFRFKGFFTSYFRVTEILDARSKTFRYQLRPQSTRWPERKHPCAAMTFVGYGNFTDTTRQTSRYSTRTYERFLCGVNDWEISPTMIAAQFGDLSNLSVHGLQMTGYSAYLNNIYMSGTIHQFELLPLRLEFDTQGDNFLAYGETLTVTCKVFKGFDDVTDQINSWTIVRDSGDPVEDAAWAMKAKVAAFHGSITICFTPEENDLGATLSTLFTVTAQMIVNNEPTDTAIGNLVF